ncbi:MAG: hypothetical protein GYB33_21240 [Gammaproteobacteria bacterium]|nr:hypothetical protein [Gammaproteobacteria bacterium]
MDTLDYFIVVIGAVLIVIGLYLFIAGKSGDASNNVEGFGIKLNVSNPSIILIVLGIGLVLVPRFLPQKASPTLGQTPIVAVESPVNKPASSDEQTVRQQLPPVTATQLPPVTQTPSPATATTQVPPSVSAPPPSAAFLPSGNWYMNSYEENGVDLSATVNGNIAFDKATQSQLSWRANLTAIDMWGNGGSYFYQGKISAVGAGHQMSVLNSNDPAFTPQSGLPLTLKMDPSGLLHMEYPYQGSYIIIHWRQ